MLHMPVPIADKLNTTNWRLQIHLISLTLTSSGLDNATENTTYFNASGLGLKGCF